MATAAARGIRGATTVGRGFAPRSGSGRGDIGNHDPRGRALRLLVRADHAADPETERDRLRSECSGLPAPLHEGSTDVIPAGRRRRAGWLRTSAVVAVTIATLISCAIQVPAPPPPKIALPQPTLDTLQLEPPGWVAVTDFAKRIEVPGASVLSPAQSRPWRMGRWRQGQITGVAFGTRTPSNGMVFAIVGSHSAKPEDWRLIRSVEPTVFKEWVRQSIEASFAESDRVRDVEVQADVKADAMCGRYRLRADSIRGGQSGPGRRGVISASGRTCLHSDAPRFIALIAGQWVPDGTPPESVGAEVSLFLESLQFLPLAVVRRL